jgi:hypothetical protein
MSLKHIAAILFVLGASLCYEESTEYDRIRTYEAFVAGRYWETPVQWKQSIVPVFLAGRDLEPSQPYRARFVERYYLFGLISTKSRYQNNHISINIKQPGF